MTCRRKCDPYVDHADQIGEDLRQLNHDAFVNVTSVYRCAYFPNHVARGNVPPEKLEWYELDFEHWVDLDVDLITFEGKFSKSNLTIYLGRDFQDTEQLGRNPSLMFSRVGRDLRAPLVQLMYNAAFGSK